MIFLGKKAKEALTPPNSYDKNVKADKDVKSNFQQNGSEKDAKEKKPVNEENQYGEIGKRLIKYIFNVDPIISISFAAVEKFMGLTLKDEDQIKSLKNILSNEHNTFATFSASEEYAISQTIHDCRNYYYTSGC